MDIGLFGGHEKKLRIRLSPAGPEVRVEFLRAHVGQVARMAVTVKIHDDGSIDAHIFEDRLERRRPVESFLEGLYGVGEMPMRGRDLVAIQWREAIAARVAQHFGKRTARLAVRE